MRAQSGTLATLLAVAGILAAGATYSQTAHSGQPAVWMPRDLIVTLTDLPKRYTCNDLWYRFHDILLDVGARNVRIITYRCEKALGPLARSPRVHLRFDFPQALPSGSAGRPELSIAATTVRLTPGQPHSMEVSDCELLRQIKDTLLHALGLRVVDYKLDCAAPMNARAPVFLAVQASLPETGIASASAATAVKNR